LAGPVEGRRPARLRLRRPTGRAHVFLDRVVAAVETICAEAFEHALGGDARLEAIEFRGAWFPCRSRAERGVLLRAPALVRREHGPHRVAAHARRARDGPSRETVARERDDLVDELLATTPRRHAASCRPREVLITASSARSTGARRPSASRRSSAAPGVKVASGDASKRVSSRAAIACALATSKANTSASLRTARGVCSPGWVSRARA